MNRIFFAIKTISLCLLAVFLCALPKPLHAQRHHVLPMNLVDYDDTPYHFGFTLSANYMSFRLNTVDGYNTRIYDSQSVDSVFNFGNGTQMKINDIQVVANPGFSVGIVGNLRLGKYFDLRVIPGLTLAFRQVVFDFDEKRASSQSFTHFYLTDQHKSNMQIESVFIDLPLMLKFKGQRIYNVRPYIIGGVEYKFDLLAVKSIQNKSGRKNDFVPLRPHDLYGTIGTGFDFYMFWFKLGVELRMAFGIFDVVNRDVKNSFCTRNIDYLKSNQFNITFTFE